MNEWVPGQRRGQWHSALGDGYGGREGDGGGDGSGPLLGDGYGGGEGDGGGDGSGPLASRAEASASLGMKETCAIVE